MRLKQIIMAHYGLGYVSKRGFRSELSMTKLGSYGMEDGPGKVHNRHGVWCDGHQSKFSNNR